MFRGISGGRAFLEPLDTIISTVMFERFQGISKFGPGRRLNTPVCTLPDDKELILTDEAELIWRIKRRLNVSTLVDEKELTH